jgi:hypothetical protein
MCTTETKYQFDDQREKVYGVAKEFAEKVKTNPGVVAVIADPYGTYLNLIVLLEPHIERHLQRKVVDSYREICIKYDGQITFELSPMTCFSSERIDEMAYDDPNSIIYRKGNRECQTK